MGDAPHVDNPIDSVGSGIQHIADVGGNIGQSIGNNPVAAIVGAVGGTAILGGIGGIAGGVALPAAINHFGGGNTPEMPSMPGDTSQGQAGGGMAIDSQAQMTLSQQLAQSAGNTLFSRPWSQSSNYGDHQHVQRRSLIGG